MAKTKYSMSKFVKNGDSLDSNFINLLITSPTKSLYLIPQHFKYRPDLIAKALYGDSNLRWVLESMNRTTNIEEWASGRYLWYVSRNTLDSLYTKWKRQYD